MRIVKRHFHSGADSATILRAQLVTPAMARSLAVTAATVAVEMMVTDWPTNMEVDYILATKTKFAFSFQASG